MKTKDKVYNIVQKVTLRIDDLKEGESFCRKCKGSGGKKYSFFSSNIDTCNKCLGKGILDWVSQVIPLKIMPVDTSSSGITITCPPTPPPKRYLNH